MKQMRLTTTFSVRDFFFSSHFILLWATASWFLWSKLRRHLSALYPICTQLWPLCGPGLFHSHVPVLSPGRKGSGSSLGSQQGVSRSRIQQLSRFSERWKENAGLANGLDVFLFKKSSSRIEKIDFLGCFLFFFFFLIQPSCPGCAVPMTVFLHGRAFPGFWADVTCTSPIQRATSLPRVAVGFSTSSLQKCCFELRGLIYFWFVIFCKTFYKVA